MLQQRMVLDRRCLEEGFLLLATLEVIAKHDLPMSLMPCDRNKMVEIITEVTEHYKKFNLYIKSKASVSELVYTNINTIKV